MISLTRLNGQGVIVNAELIESLEARPTETVVTLSTSNRLIVRETVKEIISKVVEYRARILLEKEKLKGLPSYEDTK